MQRPIYPVSILDVGDAGNLSVRFDDGGNDQRDVIVTHPDLIAGLHGLLRLIDSLNHATRSDAT